ncbi:MAG: hypothetical protein Q4D29_11660 [Lachnospiraceae bacterium]|nr:hypothetical protein [Lachnospiraceae bacterium]
MEKRKFAGNCIFILGVFAIYMLNLNFYNVYIKMRSINYVIAAAVFTAVFLCYVDFKLIFKDRLFIAVLCINAIAALFIVVNGGVNTAALTVYIFTLCLYLYDKVKFSKIQILILAIFIGAFFIYWTIDVKGYFKGYSINFGGLVLISGFVFLVVLLETLKYCVINFCDKKFVFLKKYPYYITFLETILFYIGAKIIAYYQSRTGIMVLITFALILVIPKKLMYKGITKLLCIAGAFIWMIILPLVYIYIANKGIINDLEIFYRPVIGNRASNWDVLYTLVKQHPIKGNGSIYIMEGSSFREGFLDCCNGFLQIAVVYGIVIAVCVFGMLIYVLYKQSIRITGNPFAMTAFIGTLTFIITSSSESFIFNPIFIVAFAGIIYVTNSYIEIYENVEDSDIYVAYKKRFDSSFLKKFVPVFSVTLMLCVMYFILGPLEIFYSNYLEFDFNTIDFILYFIVISIVLTMGISLVLASFRDVFSKIYCAVFLGVGIASYIQYMFLNATLSNVDGIPEFGPSIGPKYLLLYLY